MNRNSIVRLLLALSFLPLFAACASKPSHVMAEQVKRTLGSDFKGYQALTYPTNNNGVAMSYTSQPKDPNPSWFSSLFGGGAPQVSDVDYLCSTWSCFGVDSGAIPKAPLEQLRVKVRGKEYAQDFPGPNITLASEDANNYGFKVLLPKIEGILDLGVGLDAKTVTNVELKLTNVAKRLLSKADFEEYIRSNPQPAPPVHRQLKDRWAQGALTIVVGDVVAESMEATITTSGEVGPKLDAKLALLKGIVSDVNASFEMKRQSSNKYVIKSTQPVVLMRLLKQQPGAAALSAGGDWDKWFTVTSTDPTVAADGKPRHD